MTVASFLPWRPAVVLIAVTLVAASACSNGEEEAGRYEEARRNADRAVAAQASKWAGTVAPAYLTRLAGGDDRPANDVLEQTKPAIAELNRAEKARAEEFQLQVVAHEVVTKAYAEGRLGPRDKVLADMERHAQEERPVDEPVPRFFTPDGELIPFKLLNADQRMAHNSWVNSPEVLSVVGNEIVAAKDALRDKWARENESK